ncbi:endopeptidase La [Deltaproteobacteria bacterium TL4]
MSSDLRQAEAIIDESSKDLSEDKSIVVSGEIFPPLLLIFPIFNRPVFPKMMTPLVIVEKRMKKIILEALEATPGYLGLVLAKIDPEAEPQQIASVDDLHRVGVVGKIVQFRQFDKNQPLHLILQLQERFEIVELIGEAPLFKARVDYWHSVDMENNAELKAYSISIIDCMKELIQMKPLVQEELNLLISQLNVNDPGTLADFSAFMTSGSGKELQVILETKSIRSRIEQVLILLKKEVEISRLQVKINKRIEDRLSSQQREFFLKEQLKEIKKELGLTKEGKDTELELFTKRLKQLTLTEEASERVKEEMQKLQYLDTVSPEYNVTRAYLDWLTILPWGRYSKDQYDLVKAARCLNRDHYGLKDVKERILEFIAVGKTKGEISGSIILLVGPPGVGKTSVGQSIAKAIGRRFFRFSLGGMRDEAEIKGHRRTYIGALPGKFLNAIKMCKTANPIIMLDEVDKIGASFQGDPASALLEVLDPEQNQDFLDHYLDVRFDLSKVLFICTANQLETIPGPLLDRMEVIKLSGYILEDKIQIAKKHLLPKQLKQHGLTSKQFKIPTDVLRLIIDGYAREAGVRGLENQLKKIIRKSTKLMVEEGLQKILIQPEQLPQLLGRKMFEEDQLYKKPRIGVVCGLAYTSLGGATLYIEATQVAAKDLGFKQTGQLGDVMVESSEIAYTFVRSYLDKHDQAKDFFNQHFIHLHVPAGATPKDGPSAGITMACALYSLAINQPLLPGIAMTGELTLNGLVMPIGGVKEKLLAAKRAKLKNIIFPEDNRMDFDELEDYIKSGIQTHFIKDFEQVLKICFADQ